MSNWYLITNPQQPQIILKKYIFHKRINFVYISKMLIPIKMKGFECRNIHLFHGIFHLCTTLYQIKIIRKSNNIYGNST